MTTRWLDAAAIAATTADLVALQSVGGAEAAAQAHIAGWLSSAGVEVTAGEVATRDLRDHPRYSAEIDRPVVPTVIARVPGSGRGRNLLLNAHVDVVPAAAQSGWSTDPFLPVTRDGLLFGRGTADTLGGLAAAMHLMALLAEESRSGDGLVGDVVLTPVAGEEDGGCGTLASLVSGDLEGIDGAIVIEPTGLAIATAVAGALCFRIDVPGRTAHGSVRAEGVSAIEKAFVIHRAVLDLEAEQNRAWHHPLFSEESLPFPTCMGRIEGGDYRCDEASWARLEGRYGVAPHIRTDAAKAALERRVAEVSASDPWLQDHPATVSWIGAQWLPGETPATDPLVQAIAAASPTSPLRAMGYGCDMGLLRDVAEVPTIVYGPGEVAAAHAPDEHVRVADLATCARTLVTTARRFCGPG